MFNSFSYEGRPAYRCRAGVAVVEAAVTLPLIALIVVALIQFVNMIFLRQKVTSACYVGMQQLSQPNATELAVRNTIQAILTTRGVQNATIDIQPAGVLDLSPSGIDFSVRILAPFSSNLSGPRIIPTSGNVDVQTVDGLPWTLHSIFLSMNSRAAVHKVGLEWLALRATSQLSELPRLLHVPTWT